MCDNNDVKFEELYYLFISPAPVGHDIEEDGGGDGVHEEDEAVHELGGAVAARVPGGLLAHAAPVSLPHTGHWCTLGAMPLVISGKLVIIDSWFA